MSWTPWISDEINGLAWNTGRSSSTGKFWVSARSSTGDASCSTDAAWKTVRSWSSAMFPFFDRLSATVVSSSTCIGSSWIGAQAPALALILLIGDKHSEGLELRVLDIYDPAEVESNEISSGKIPSKAVSSPKMSSSRSDSLIPLMSSRSLLSKGAAADPAWSENMLKSSSGKEYTVVLRCKMRQIITQRILVKKIISWSYYIFSMTSNEAFKRCWKLKKRLDPRKGTFVIKCKTGLDSRLPMHHRGGWKFDAHVPHRFEFPPHRKASWFVCGRSKGFTKL